MALEDLSQNLRALCGLERSVSEVCRRIGINRQQFNKYLNGASRPSSFNLQRICAHFQVQPAELYLPPYEFADRLRYRSGSRPGPGSRRDEVLKAAFPGDRRALGRYLGYYHSYFHSFGWEGRVMRSLACLYEQEGSVFSKTIERVRDPAENVRYFSKYDGLVSLLGNRLFVVEFQRSAQDAIVETILYPAPRSQVTLLRGVTFGVSSKGRNAYVSRTAWKYLGRTVDQRSALGATGLLPASPRAVDPHVLHILGEQPFPNERLRFDVEGR